MHMTQIASPQHEVKPPLERWRHVMQVAALPAVARRGRDQRPACERGQPRQLIRQWHTCRPRRGLWVNPTMARKRIVRESP